MSVLNFRYENFENIINLVYEINDKSQIDSVEHGMLTNNSIDGLLKMSYSSLDDKFYYKYNVSSKISLHRYLESEINKKKLLNILSNIINTLLEVEDYMILKEHLVLDKRYIYIDVSNSDAYMVCLPITRQTEDYDIRAFIKNLLFNAKFEQAENTNYISILINELNKDEIFNLKKFLDVINKLKINSSAKLLKTNKISDNQMPISTNSTNKMFSNEPKEQTNKIVEDIIVSSGNSIDSKKTEQQESNVDKKIESKLENKLENLFSIFHKDEDKDKDKDKKDKNNKNAKKKENPKKNNNKYGFEIPSIDNNLSSESADIIENDINSNLNNESKPKGIFNFEFKNLDKKNKKDKNELKDDNIKIEPILTYDINIKKQFENIKNMTNYESTSDDTCLLSDLNNNKSRAYIIRKFNNESIYITKDLFKIGKEPTYVDYIIEDNKTISRTHADIIKDGNDYFIQDNNSKNHTYVNNILVKSGEKVKLENNFIIKLSNEEFIFRIS